MTIETGGLVERRRETVGYASKKLMKKKQRCRKRRRQGGASEYMVPRAALQKLFVLCKDVFKGPGSVPSPFDVQRLSNILDEMKPEDVGLSRSLHFFKPSDAVRGTPRVTYTTVYQCDKFSLCIFFLPATAVIPLHNHPGMTVFSKLLLGTMHIKAYDWIDSSLLTNNSQLKLARLKTNCVFRAPCNNRVLYPTSGGNIHELTAITPCAVLDVLGPPYSAKDARDCSYYKHFPYHAFPYGETLVRKEDDSYGWLQEIEVPEDSLMDGIEYMGPQVIDTPC